WVSVVSVQNTNLPLVRNSLSAQLPRSAESCAVHQALLPGVAMQRSHPRAWTIGTRRPPHISERSEGRLRERTDHFALFLHPSSRRPLPQRSVPKPPKTKGVMDADYILLWQPVALAQWPPAILPLKKFVREPELKLGISL